MEHEPFALLKGPSTFRENKLVFTRRAHNPGRGVPFRILAIGMVEGGEPTTRTHLFIKCVGRGRTQRSETTNLLLIRKAIEVLFICIPRDEVRIPGAQFWVSFVA
jgi:hypothetical protein